MVVQSFKKLVLQNGWSKVADDSRNSRDTVIVASTPALFSYEDYYLSGNLLKDIFLAWEKRDVRRIHLTILKVQ